MSRHSFVLYILTAAILSVVFDYILHIIWLERAGIVPYRESVGYYLVKLLIVLFVVAFFSNITRFARPVVLGFIGSVAFGLYYALTRPLIPMGDAFIMFLAHWLAISLGTGIADGLIRGYQLKGVRGR